MTFASPIREPDLAEQLSYVLDEMDRLRNRVRLAESNSANLERALESNRRIGIAIGILICRHQLTADRAFEILKICSQHRNVKVRELAETVIYTGTL